MQTVVDKLFSLQDEKYAKFQANLTPGIVVENIIGVRVPKLRELAKEMYKDGSYKEFVKELPHKYYDENMLHSAIMCLIKDYDEAIELMESFLPYIDNWAVCDTIKPKAFAKNKDKLIEKIREWSSSTEAYTIRFGIEMLMSFYLDDDFLPEYLEIPVNYKNDDYYVKMMVAWFFATALAKQWTTAVEYIENKRLEKWTHNKSIQKAIESYRVTDEQKEYLRTLKIKG